MGGYWKIGSFLTILAIIFLIDLLTETFLSPLLGRLPFVGELLLHAAIVAALASPFLCRFVIEPFRRVIVREAKKSSVVLDAAPEAILEVTRHGQIRSMNAEALRLFGYRREELIGKEVEILLPEQLRSRHAELREEYARNPRARPMSSSNELVGRKKNGEEFPVLASLSTAGETEDPLIICVVRDVSPQRAAKNEIAQINEKLTRSLAAHKALSETLSQLSNYGELLQSCTTRPEAYPIVAKMCEHLFPGQCGSVYLATASKTALERVISWGQRGTKPILAIQECWALRRGKMHTDELAPCAGCKASEGRRHDQRTMCVPMIAQGDMIGILHLSTALASSDRAATPTLPAGEPDAGVLTAVVERIGIAIANLRLREELREQAIRDSMTGLFNRRFLEEYLELELLRAMRNGRPLTVMMLDVDHFKRFNDTFGHKAGDLVLQEISAVLRAQTRGSDIACRFGGEELVIVSPETALDQGFQRAEQLRRAVEDLTVIVESRPLGKVTISIGVACAPQHGYDMQELLRAADEALYRAKKTGRNRVLQASGPSALVPTKAERAATADAAADVASVQC